MKVYFTQSCQHLAKGFDQGNIAVQHFANGELYVRVLDKPGKNCGVIASFPAPAENILELCLILDALTRLGTKITLVITYFGYARQDRVVEPGDAVGLEVVAKSLQQFRLRDVYVIHPHSLRTQQVFPCHAIVPFFEDVLDDIEIIVAPDFGAADEASSIAEHYGLSVAYIEKVRHFHDVKAVRLIGDVKGKRALIVDDIIDLGTTIKEAAKILLTHGALSVDAYATHGVFSGPLHDMPVRSLTVTDTLPQKGAANVKSIVPIIRELFHSLHVPHK